MVFSHWSQHRYRHHRAVANIAERSFRRCQYRGEKNNILILKNSLRHWLQIPNLFMGQLPTVPCSE
jgi:hypothetical protein